MTNNHLYLDTTTREGHCAKRFAHAPSSYNNLYNALRRTHTYKQRKAKAYPTASVTAGNPM